MFRWLFGLVVVFATINILKKEPFYVQKVYKRFSFFISFYLFLCKEKKKKKKKYREKSYSVIFLLQFQNFLYKKKGINYDPPPSSFCSIK
jgi:hypothetical protein